MNILKKYGIKPLKRLGQNFLIDKFAVKRVILAAEVKPNDVILEIGSGSGILTRELAKKAGKVVAVEKDRQMVEVLKETLKGFDNVEVVCGDILKLNPIPYTLKLYKVVANLPFYLTAPVIRKFLEWNGGKPRCMVLVVQKEVAQRICAKPPKMNLLAVSVQFYAEPKIVRYISKTSFWPQPKVDSAVIKIEPRNKYAYAQILPKQFFRIVKAGFSQPRKQLANNLAKGLKLDKTKVSAWLLKNKIAPEQRAETLTIEGWLNLTKTLDE